MEGWIASPLVGGVLCVLYREHPEPWDACGLNHLVEWRSPVTTWYMSVNSADVKGPGIALEHDPEPAM